MQVLLMGSVPVQPGKKGVAQGYKALAAQQTPLADMDRAVLKCDYTGCAAKLWPSKKLALNENVFNIKLVAVSSTPYP